MDQNKEVQMYIDYLRKVDLELLLIDMAYKNMTKKESAAFIEDPILRRQLQADLTKRKNNIFDKLCKGKDSLERMKKRKADPAAIAALEDLLRKYGS